MEDRKPSHPLTSDMRRQRKRRYSLNNCKPKKSLFPSLIICVKSKALMLILIWSSLIGAIYISLLNSLSVLGFVVQDNTKYRAVIWTVLGAYTLLAMIRLVYPLSGFLADTYCGRYKAMAISFFTLLVAMLCFSISTVIGCVYMSLNISELNTLVPFTIFVVVAIMLITAGLAGYQANIVQFGLDQLLEAPSKNLGLFIHWLMWTHTLGGFVIHVLFAIFPCHLSDDDPLNEPWRNMLASLPFVYLVTLMFLLSFTCYNHRWFYTEPGRNNPYKTVYKVLKFAKKNNYPPRRSAFTYCDDKIPTRIDFGKERYGGPFTTEQVEDVKTFLRIVLVLITLGPVFILEVPSSYYIFPFFALHISKSPEFTNHSCRSVVRCVVLESGGLGYIVSILFVPVYMWVIYSLLQKRMPRILCRLWCTFLTAIIGVVSLLLIDLIGHILYKTNNPKEHREMCMFTADFMERKSSSREYTVLNIPSAVNIIPSLILNPAFLLTEITAFEFISAQSPLSMKGLLVGVYFSIKGIFQCISAVAFVPFALQRIWSKNNLIHNPPITNCAFGYYLFTIIAAAVGFVLFSIVVKRYKYRQRDERPYDQRFAEQYYHRCITERVENSEWSQTERSNSDVDIFESLSYDYRATETDVELSDSS